MNNINVLVGVMYLKEASDLLQDTSPELSFKLLELSQFLLNDAKISAESMKEADNIIEEISTDLSSN